MTIDHDRRRLLKSAAAYGFAFVAPPAWRHPSSTPIAATDLCASSSSPRQPLRIPGDRGYLGLLALRGQPLTLTARIREGSGGDARALEFSSQRDGSRYSNPTLIVQRGEHVRIRLANALREPTITHWHGLSVAAANDGNGSVLAEPGKSYDYDFELSNRAGMYWYHPHPHGRSATQTYRGLFGALLVDDDEERALRAALDLTLGRTDVPLILQDRRSKPGYSPSPADMMHGFFGDEMLVNGTRNPYLDVSTRIYRLRLLNAANSRTLRIAFRTGAGTFLPFTLIGNDGGLLPYPIECQEIFLATAERADILIDLRNAHVGDSVLMHTLEFDPMHAEVGEEESSDHSTRGGKTGGHDHAPMSRNTPSHDHSAHHAAYSWPEGEARVLVELRVRKRVDYERAIPSRLSTTLSPIDTAKANERSFRLGFAKGRWRINDRVFEMGMPPVEIARNSVETWLIRNYHSSMPHAMHLHGFHFEVLARETSPEQIVVLQRDMQSRLATDLGRKDTILVWPGESVRIAIDFALSYPGPQRYLFHCHNLEHEDGGMMLPVLVT